ncbi:MAG TPA: glycosyltransferase family 2 protein [Acidimicrobiia bacterium]|nr:glycosyltransferase family 2 protein [Acidimicrobiia bacterium]
MTKSPSISVVLPAYQLGSVIAANVERVAAILEPLSAEIIVVDDGSTDQTRSEALRATASISTASVLSHPVNRGKGQALFTGARAATGDLIVFLDADLDLPPEQLPELLAGMGDTDVLVGAKRDSMAAGRYPVIRRLLSRLFSLATVGLFRLTVTETQTGLKIFRRDVLEKVVPQMRIDGYAYDLEMLVRAQRAGFKLTQTPVELGPGASTASLRGSMLWQMARDTARLQWWVWTGGVPKP